MKKQDVSRAKPVLLTNARWQVTLSESVPQILCYEPSAGQRRLMGGEVAEGPAALVCRLSDRAYLWIGAECWSDVRVLSAESCTARYAAIISQGTAPAVELEIVYTLTEDGLELALENVREREGYELIKLRFADVVTVSEERPGASLVVPSHAGRLIRVAECPPFETSHPQVWIHPAPVGVVYDDYMAGIVFVPSADDLLLSAVKEEPDGRRYGALSVELVYRAQAAPPAPQFVVGGVHRCLITPTTDTGPDGKVTWISALSSWRDRIKAAVNRLYVDGWVYKIFLDCPGRSDYTTFDEALQLVRRIHAITNGAPQVAYLVGWQHRGHDTGYPDVFTVNARLGGKEALERLVREAAELGCIVSFHDNYDDAYMDSPEWDPDIIARDSSGELMKGGIWAGGQSYIIGACRYSRVRGPERVNRTLEMFPIRKSYHIDVLSAEAVRYDYHPDHPAGAQKNVEGKRSIIREFNNRGIDVTSEGLSYPFVGHIGHAWHLLRDRNPVFPVEERIPLAPFLYHGKITYGGGNDPGDPPVIGALLYGATYARDYDKTTPDKVLADTYYLVVLPASLVADRQMTDYQAVGTTRTVWYGADTFVEADEEAETYRMVVDGKLIAQNFSSFIPVSERSALVYSRSAATLIYPAPAGWQDGSALRAFDLLAQRPCEAEIWVEGGRVIASVEAGHPLLVEC